MSPPTERSGHAARVFARLAPAKVNLTLHVTGQRSDGYHLLDSLVVFADFGDRLTLHAEAPLGLSVSGPRADGVPTDNSNLILQAAAHIGATRGTMHLEKHLPAAAGIGGGSSDAATALRLYADAHNIALTDDGATLGADVPVCLRGRATRMQGVGEQLSPVPDLPPLPAVLVNPGVAVATPAVFKALARKDNPPMPDPLPHWSSTSSFAAWLATQRNDLEAPARKFAPEIGAVVSELAASDGCLLARMSGSGATCFGLYADQESAIEAATKVAAAQPAWWVVPTALR